MKILITGGCGFIGSILVNQLLEQKHDVTVVDTQWFGNFLTKHKNLIIKKKDFRDLNIEEFNKIDSIIHLANIANDPGVELNPLLSWDVNVLGLKELLHNAIKKKVKQFIFSSSGSVYGIKKEKKVTENLDLVPISIYNKTKMIAERVILSFNSPTFKTHIIRPATVCGYSPRMRLDVSVNMLTFQALKFKKITLFGGTQIRPNIHISDLSRTFVHFIKKPNLPSGFYNAGFENLSLLELSKMIQKKIPCDVKIKNLFDPRSYRLDSSKLLKTGFSPNFRVIDAIEEITEKYKKGFLKNEASFYTVKWMKKLKLHNKT
mgnify:FL=1